MRTQVLNWLKNPDRCYADGVLLFEAIASDDYKSRYLDYFKKKTDINMLISKIRALLPSVPESEKTIPEQPEIIISETVRPENIPAEKQPFYDRITEIRPLQASLHSELSIEANPSKRKVIVDDLLSLESERHEMWQKIDAKEESLVPGSEENPLERGARLMKRQKQLKQNIARGKCSPEKLSRYEAELASINEELKL